MGVYSGANAFDSVSYIAEDTLGSIVNDDAIEVSESEDLAEIGLDAVANIEENYNMVMKTIGVNELNAIENTGKEFVYTEGVLSDLGQSVKKFILKVWDKIKALFKRFIMIFDKYTKDDKEFLNKYKDQLFQARNLDNFTFKGYEYTFENVEAAIKKCEKTEVKYDGISKDSNKDEDTRSEKIDEEIEKLRAEVANALRQGNGNALDQAEFVKAIHEGLRNGESEKQELSSFNVGKIATELSTSSDTKKNMDKWFTTSKRVINTAIKDSERYSREILRNAPSKTGDQTKDDDNNNETSAKMKHFSNEMALIRAAQGMMVTVNSQALSALKERSRQNKALAVALIRRNSKNESSVSEGWQHSDMTQANFLSGVEFK